MADKNIQITVRNPVNTEWDELYPITKAENIIGVGEANGIAILDAAGNVPSSQLGNVPTPVLSADNITLDNANLAATNVNAGMTELFTNVSNGKSSIASAITGMGQIAAGSDSFATLATKISDISDDATSAVGDVLSGKTFYQGGSKRTGTMPNRGTVNQSLAINGSYTIPSGYHSGSGKVTQSITTKSAQTFTPSTANQTIAAGQYLSGTQTILGDADLISANIKSGKNIFGVAGNAYVVDTSAGDAAASQILSGRKAYVDGALVTGTIPSKAAQTFTPSTANQTIAAGQYLSGTQTIAGDPDLVAGNIKQGVNIFGVVGTLPETFYSLTASDTVQYSSLGETASDQFYHSDSIPDANEPTSSVYGYSLNKTFGVALPGMVRITFDVKATNRNSFNYVAKLVLKNSEQADFLATWIGTTYESVSVDVYIGTLLPLTLYAGSAFTYSSDSGSGRVYVKNLRIRYTPSKNIIV